MNDAYTAISDAAIQMQEVRNIVLAMLSGDRPLCPETLMTMLDIGVDRAADAKQAMEAALEEVAAGRGPFSPEKSAAVRSIGC